MSEPYTPIEQYLVSEWGSGRDKKSVLDALLGAAGYAIALGRTDDAEDMCFCAKVALEIAYSDE